MTDYITYRLPASWSGALINADRTGLSDAEAHELDVWLANQSDTIGGECLSADEFDDFDRTPDLPEYAGPVMTYTFPRKAPINDPMTSVLDISALVDCAMTLVTAYKRGENGEHVDWDEINIAWELALLGLTPDAIAEAEHEAGDADDDDADDDDDSDDDDVEETGEDVGEAAEFIVPQE